MRDGRDQRKIVMFRKGVDVARWQHRLETANNRVIKYLKLINALVLEPESQDSRGLEALSAHPDVLAIEDDGFVKTLVLGLWRRWRPPQLIPWGIKRIRADKAWDYGNGEGAKVAILDTGVDISHPDLKDNIRDGKNILNPDSTPKDDNGHGTHVAGIIGAVNNGIGVVGVAPAASLYPVKVLDRSGRGSISDVIDGLGWCVENQVQVVNMSFGGDHQRALQQGIKAAFSKGLILVAAAGNSGPSGGVSYPAAYPQVIAVAATTPDDRIADFSSRGREVSLAAPGKDIPSTSLGGRYTEGSGTSFAAPHVSGVAALLVGRNSGRWQREVITGLLNSAEQLPGWDRNAQGAGVVNAESALRGGTRRRNGIN